MSISWKSGGLQRRVVRGSAPDADDIVVQAAGVDQQMTEEFQRMFDCGGRRSARSVLLHGIDHGYVRANIDVRATAQTIVAIPFGVALRYGQNPGRDVLIARPSPATNWCVAGSPMGGRSPTRPSWRSAGSDPGGSGNGDAIGEAIGCPASYLVNHPVASLSTAGGQMVLGLRALQYLFLDIVKWRFNVREFLNRPR